MECGFPGDSLYVWSVQSFVQQDRISVLPVIAGFVYSVFLPEKSKSQIMDAAAAFA
ncbi:MAG: hypothetical protein ACLRZZ_07875 [Enterocloster sp.]